MWVYTQKCGRDWRDLVNLESGLLIRVEGGEGPCSVFLEQAAGVNPERPSQVAANRLYLAILETASESAAFMDKLAVGLKALDLEDPHLRAC